MTAPIPTTAVFRRVFGGYGYNDYGATCYVDIDPLGQTGLLGSSLATPYRNKLSRVNGLLKQGKTRIAEITDGTSNTIMHWRRRWSRPALLEPLHSRRICGHRAERSLLRDDDRVPGGGEPE